MTTRDAGMKDLWSASDGYKRRFQRDDEVRDVLDLLELRDAGLGEAGIALRRATFWAFEFPYLDQHQVSLVRARGLDETLRLKQVNDETWCVTLYWFRFLGLRQFMIVYAASSSKPVRSPQRTWR